MMARMVMWQGSIKYKVGLGGIHQAQAGIHRFLPQSAFQLKATLLKGAAAADVAGINACIKFL